MRAAHDAPKLLPPARCSWVKRRDLDSLAGGKWREADKETIANKIGASVEERIGRVSWAEHLVVSKRVVDATDRRH